MKKIKLACLFGGASSEYEVSLVSASSVIRHINKEKYEIIKIGITRKGDLYLYEGDIESIEKDRWLNKAYCKKVTFSVNRSDHGIIVLEGNKEKIIKIDIVFPILHGRNGEDGRLQGLFELSGIKYVGCDMLSSSLCMNKYLAHELVRMHDITVPKTYLFDVNDTYNQIEKKIENLNYPIFVKPLRAGSSFGITKVKAQSELSGAITKAFNYDSKIVIEENIDGFEVGCAILGINDLIIGEVDEIEIQDGFFDYEEKYTLKTSKIHLPARIEKEERERIKIVATKIYKILGCTSFARVDMFYTKDKKIVFNEVNTIPGFTSHSRYPSMLKMTGLDFSEIIDKLISMKL